MPYEIAILDDEEIFVEMIDEIVMLYSSENKNIFTVKKYTNSFLFLSDIESGVRFDVYFLDIVMPFKSGIAIAEMLQKKAEAIIVFITAYEKYAADGYKYGAFRYIHKSNLKKELFLALRAISKKLTLQRGEFIIVDTPKYSGKLYLKEIVYLYKKSKNTIIVLNGIEKSIAVRRSLGEVYTDLSPEEFCWVDRCYIVNLHYIRGVESKWCKIVLDNGEKIDISKSHVHKVKDCISRYWGKDL